MPIGMASVPERSAAPSTRKKRNPRKPCRHIGEPLTTIGGCSTAQLSVWQCELHGKCYPLAYREMLDPSVVTCAYCKDWEAHPEPSVFAKAVSVGTAAAKWLAAGKPVRSQERVNEILAICQACPFLVSKKSGDTYCGKCGCPVNAKLEARNKLYLCTEECPLDPPRWKADA